MAFDMSETCQVVVFSNKAYNAIIRESFDKDPVETGGILLGHILDNGAWIVMEVLPPGLQSIFQFAYFEYDVDFVNYLASSVANQYKKPLDLLGLWHRHPGSLDTFSNTDDSTNTIFARQNSKGVISGLVNIDPRFRFTMYHLDHQTSTTRFGRPMYTQVEIAVGDDLIPDEYRELRYFNGDEDDLHPYVKHEEHKELHTVQPHRNRPEATQDAPHSNIQQENGREYPPYMRKNSQSFFESWRNLKNKGLYICVGLIFIAGMLFSFQRCADRHLTHKIIETLKSLQADSSKIEGKSTAIDTSMQSLLLQQTISELDSTSTEQSSDSSAFQDTNDTISPNTTTQL